MSNEDQIDELKRLVEEEKKELKARKAEYNAKRGNRTDLEYQRQYNKQRAENDPDYWKKKYEKTKETGEYANQLERQKEYKRVLRQDAAGRKKLAAQGAASRNKKQEQEAGRPRPNTCEICSEPGRISFDHCHNSGKFRGWLCVRCNLILGHVKDDPVLLEKMAVYLRSHDP